jgi:integral membrane protein (TIGR01906 family)
VFGGFGLLAVASAVVVVAAVAGARRLGHPERAWRAVRNGARGLIVAVVLAGVIAVVAFDALFEVFHRLLFAGGSYTFDPATERLVQLFPFRFWSETTMAVGAVIVAVAILVSVVAGRRASPAIALAPPGGADRPASAVPGTEPGAAG